MEDRLGSAGWLGDRLGVYRLGEGQAREHRLGRRQAGEHRPGQYMLEERLAEKHQSLNQERRQLPGPKAEAEVQPPI